MVGQVGHGQLDLHEAHRFANTPVRVLGTLHWDILGLYRGMLDGLGAAARAFDLASVGIDSWGVDYGLLDAGGALLGNPVHYRDTRTDGVVDDVLAKVPAADLYAVTGIQQMPINTIYQLAADGADAAAGRGADPAADPRPARLLADRGDRRRGDERVHHPAVRHPGPGLGLGPDRPGRPARRAVPGAAPARQRHRDPAAGSWPRSRAWPGWARVPAGRAAAGDRDRVARHRVRRGRRARPGPRTSRTSPAAPGPWSAWSWTSRC